MGVATALVLLGCGADDDPVTPQPPESPTVQRVEVWAQRGIFEVGDSVQLRATAVLSDGTRDTEAPVTWTSLDTLVVRVSQAGRAYGLAPGATEVRAEMRGGVGHASVQVLALPVTLVAASVDSLMLDLGVSDSLSARAFNRRGEEIEGPVVLWSSTDTSVVGIDGRGWLSTRRTGTAFVVAQVEGVEDSVPVVVADRSGLAPVHLATMRSLLDEFSSGDAFDIIRTGADSTVHRILSDPRYGVAEWASFFTGYLATRRFSGGLHVLLSHWAYTDQGALEDPSLRRRLQRALIEAILGRLETSARLHPDRLGQRALADPDLSETLARSALFTLLHVVNLRRDGHLEALALDMERIDAGWGQVVARQPRLMQTADATLRRVTHQVHRTIVEALPLTAERRRTIAEVLDLAEEQRRLLDDFGVLATPWRPSADGVAEGQFEDEHLDILHEHLGLLPRVPELRHVQGNECCFAQPGEHARVAVGSLDLHTGWTENTFPADSEARTIPGFVSIWIHEFHHQLDFARVQGDPIRRARWRALISRAGEEPANYLRSMIDAGFFVAHPIELIASSSQMYVVDSQQTFNLALARFAAGRPEPLNQFLFMVDLYADGADETHFFVTAETGHLARNSVPVIRNARGHITGLSAGGRSWEFEVDDDGWVLSVRGP